MKIVSWNILANEFITPGELPPIDRKNRLTQICKVLKQIDADIIFLQEVMFMEYRHFLKVFPSYDIFRGKNLCWYNRASHSGNIILLRFKSNVTVYDFSFGIGLQLPSMCLLNVHLDDLSHTKRTHQIKQLLPFIYRENNIILGGDLNQNYKSTTHLYKLLTDGGLKIYMKDPTYFLDKKMSIDHIMTKGLPHGVSTSVDSHGGDFIKQFKNYGSDHLPVVLNI